MLVTKTKTTKEDSGLAFMDWLCILLYLIWFLLICIFDLSSYRKFESIILKTKLKRKIKTDRV